MARRGASQKDSAKSEPDRPRPRSRVRERACMQHRRILTILLNPTNLGRRVGLACCHEGSSIARPRAIHCWPASIEGGREVAMFRIARPQAAVARAGTRYREVSSDRPLERIGTGYWFWARREDRVRGHRLEATRCLDVGWANSFVLRTEIDGFIADAAGEADGVPTLTTHPPGKSFVTAGLPDAVASGRSFAACVITYGFGTST
jgi:hypothetical protein